jgi:hypothetical protein
MSLVLQALLEFREHTRILPTDSSYEHYSYFIYVPRNTVLIPQSVLPVDDMVLPYSEAAVAIIAAVAAAVIVAVAVQMK